MQRSTRVVLAIGVLVAALIASLSPVIAQGTCPSSICTTHGFRLALVAVGVDEGGVGEYLWWDYEICNEEGQGTGCEPQGDLSHFDIVIEGTFCEALAFGQESGFDQALLACEAREYDPSCGISPYGILVMCEVVPPSTLDPGECVTVRIWAPFLGETWIVETVTKLGRLSVGWCASDCVPGPNCFALPLRGCGDGVVDQGICLAPISALGSPCTFGSECDAAGGDGVCEFAEGCDDDNVVDGDGCSGECEVEPCFVCSGQPSTCTWWCCI